MLREEFPFRDYKYAQTEYEDFPDKELIQDTMDKAIKYFNSKNNVL